MGKIHKYIFIGIIILEMLFISAVVIRDLHYSQQIDISGDQMDTIDSGFMKDDIVLQRGIYGVAVNYSTAENMTAQILSKTQIISGGVETEKAYLWRLVDCYRRAAIGELCAMIFLPLLVLGLYLLVDGKSSELDREASVVKSKRMLLSLKDGNSTQIILYLVIGMTGLLQTHIITLLLTILTVLVILIFRWKDVFHLDKICILAISGITTLVINMWFIVPFVDYYINFPMAVSNGEETVLSSRALNLFDLLTVFQPWGKGKRLKYTYV